MPTTYTHYRFGTDVYKRLPLQIRQDIRPYLDLFCIGLHGPDLLFYYKALFRNPVNRLGFAMHKRPGMVFFSAAAHALGRQTRINTEGDNSVSEQSSIQTEPVIPAEDMAPSMAYLYGFLCHFALDSNCHPYVEQSVRRTGISHSEIEAELDRWYMIKDGIDPMYYHPTRHFRATQRNARVISRFFSGVGPREALTAIRSIRFYINLLTIRTPARRRILRSAMILVHCPQDLYDMVRQPKANPACASICSRLTKHYDTAVSDAAELIQNFKNHIEKGEPLDARLNHTFGEF